MTRPNVCYGDHDVATDNEILRCLVGSGVHGMAIEGTDDRDEMGVFVEPPENVIGLDGPYDSHVWRTQPEGARSGAGDVDLTIYSLRKYVRLAVQGNPTILLPLYAGLDDIIVSSYLGDDLRGMRQYIVSQVAGERFMGYLEAQRERMLGAGKRNRVPNRPELIERYGYDVKYASHALRLGLQGCELIREGYLSLPLREHDREKCLAVKRGEVPFDTALEWIDDTQRLLGHLIEAGRSPLPERPDYDRVNTWLIQAHQYHWNVRGTR